MTLFNGYKTYQQRLVLSAAALVITLFLYSRFLNFVETREGVILNDPLLSLFQPVNLTWLIFGVIYISLVFAIIILARNPAKLVEAINIYTVLIILRAAAMYLVPLNPPANTIILIDPFVEFFGTGQTLTKDLFFSGHTATLFFLYLIVDNKKMKAIFLFLTGIIAVSVILQHIHYSIDVFAAPFFSYAAYRIVKYFYSQFKIV